MTGVWRSTDAAATVERRYRQLLDTWPVPGTQRHLPTRHGDTFVVSSGPEDGAAVILLHGAGSNLAMWLQDVATWATTHRVHAVDVIGEAGLSSPTRPPLDSDAHAGWLDDVLAGLGVRHAAFVGVSLGGWLATDYATRHPDRVDRLALLCPGGIGRQKVGVALAMLPLAPLGALGRRIAVPWVLGPAGRRLVADTTGAGGFFMLINEHFRYRKVRLPVFGDDVLRRLTMPVLAVVGARDVMFDSHDTRRRLVRCVPAAEVTVLPDAGHLLVGQTDRIARFLAEA